jgi:urease accessory protein
MKYKDSTSYYQVFFACAIAVSIAMLLPQVALAHIESGEAGGFLSGLSHPVSGLDHIIAMVAVGLWGAQLGMPAI